MMPFRASLLASTSTSSGGTDVQMAVKRFATSTGAGTQDITISGLGWTPSAAIFIMSRRAGGAGSAVHGDGSYGATDGTSQWVMAWRSRDANLPTSNNVLVNRSRNDDVMMLVGSGVIDFRASFSAFISDGIQINIETNTPGLAYECTAILFGGADLEVKAGIYDHSSNPATVTTGFEANAIFFASPQTAAFDNAQSNDVFCNAGFSTWDGSTVRQSSLAVFADQGTSPLNTYGGVSASGAITSSDTSNLREMVIDNFTSTSFRSTADTILPNVGYLALRMPGKSVWTGVVNSPTSTGNQNITGASFTPSLGVMLPNMCSSLDADLTDGSPSGWGFSAFDATASTAFGWAIQDNVTPVNSASVSAAAAVDFPQHDQSTAYTGSFVGFISGGVTINFSAANGTARKWPALFIS